jgi:hypothetical protein
MVKIDGGGHRTMNALSLVSTVAALAAVTTNTRTFPVLLSRLSSVVAGLEALTKRAVRKGLTPIAWEVGKAYTVREHVNAETRCDHLSGLHCNGCRDVSRVPVTLTGEAPHFEGWTFLAALEHLDGENLVRAVPGEDVPPVYRNRGPVCDHCKANRRRNDTFVVRHEDGRTLQVGSTCVRDFLGGAAEADKLASAASILAMARGLCEGGCEGEGGSSSAGDSLLASYLPVVAWCVQSQGWISRTKAREEGREGAATADRAWTYLGSKREADRAGVAVTDEHTALAMSAEFWAEHLTDAEVDAERGDYLHNLRAVARTGLVNHRSAGIAASMVTAYQRYIGRQRQATERAARPESSYVGVVKARITVTAKLDFVTGYETQYGYTTVLKFVTEGGTVLVWKASNTDLGRDDVGKVYTVTGTVKGHEDYKGQKQTQLTRCNVVKA